MKRMSINCCYFATLFASGEIAKRELLKQPFNLHSTIYAPYTDSRKLFRAADNGLFRVGTPLDFAAGKDLGPDGNNHSEAF
jgi:hypothetical protein